MARDEFLLELVGASPGVAAWRTYTWAEPTLSLGYFQEHAQATRERRWSGLPMVRRSTGGGALLHHHEVTYALAIPAGHPLSRRTEDLYEAVHGAIAAELARLGIQARPRGGERSGRERPRPFLCFQDEEPTDLVVGSVKVVGSAQRRRAGVLLQHGSLLLTRSVVTPELSGLMEVSEGGIASDPLDWSDRLTGGVLEALGLRGVARAFDEAEERRIAELARNPFANREWLERR